MDKLKSFYVGTYVPIVFGLPIYAVISLVQGGFDIGMLGVILTTAPMASIFGFALIFSKLARTSSRLPEFILLGVVGVALAVYGVATGQGTMLGLLLALAGLTSFLIYDLWYSRFGRAPVKALEVGNDLPEFALEDEDGKPVRSKDFLGHPTIFLFFRGNWCPLCMAQIREIADEYTQLAQMGARVALISPQPHEHTRKLAAKFSVPFDFLVDVDNQAATRLQIAHKDGLPFGMSALGYDNDTVMPTLLVCDAGGKILFSDQTDNYRVRPEPETFLRILQNA